MLGLGPVHEIELQRFAVPTIASLVIDATAIAIIAGGCYLTWKRSLFGGLVLASTAALLPVLHIAPIAFDPSLYHERMP